ncbi:MAG: HlyD family secretion protein [Candidatus Kapaibacteriota bacterium]
MKKYLTLVTLILTLISCSNNQNQPDAYGNFEATEIIVSSEATGKIINFVIDEGQNILKNQNICLIDTFQLYLQKEQVEASIYAITSKVRDVQVEINVLTEKKNALLKDKNRIEKLFKDSAATQKQLDDIESQLEILDKQEIATRRGLNITNNGLLAEIKPLQVKLKQLEDQIEKCKVKSPINGVVLNKFAEQGEFATIGKPLVKIANLDTLVLRAYVTEVQLPEIKLGQKVYVYIDTKNNSLKKFEGIITFISSEAEFTPKIIQTKEERVNLVYAVKINVQNDGTLKIGMPAEVKFKL